MNAFLPASDLILNSGLTLFSKVSGLMAALVGVVFIIRVVGLQTRFAGASDYADLLKDVMLYFALVSLFPMLVKLIYSTSASLAIKISYAPVPGAQQKLDEFLSSMFLNNAFFKIVAKIGDYLIINLAQGMYSVFTALLLSIAPIFIFLSTVVGFDRGLPLFFSTLISLSLWPVIWNLIGLFGKELLGSPDSSILTIVCYWIILQLLQLMSPIFCLLLLKSLSPSGVVSKVVGLSSKLGGNK
ncbi:MAG: hypothetical protein H7336_15385 [Bacteriovorax sp.]|nr:hypothetical protein [Bacteriovorax sp.]